MRGYRSARHCGGAVHPPACNDTVEAREASSAPGPGGPRRCHVGAASTSPARYGAGGLRTAAAEYGLDYRRRRDTAYPAYIAGGLEGAAGVTYIA